MTQPLAGRGLLALTATLTLVAVVTLGIVITAKGDAITSRLDSIGALLLRQGASSSTVTREAGMITLQYSYQSVECGLVTITSTLGVGYDGQPIPGETVEQLVERHRTQIARMKELCPPAP